MRVADYEYVNMRRIVYSDSNVGDASFVPVCSKCFRFVKADETIKFRAETIADGPNATCTRCGRVEMLFEGFM